MKNIYIHILISKGKRADQETSKPDAFTDAEISKPPKTKYFSPYLIHNYLQFQNDLSFFSSNFNFINPQSTHFGLNSLKYTSNFALLLSWEATNWDI